MKYLHEIKRRNALLFYCGIYMLLVGTAMAAGLFLDSRQIFGVSVWLKPLKFALSITLYVWTAAWFLEHVNHHVRAQKRISWIVAITMFVEIHLLITQSTRGVPSHYNETSLFNTVVFNLMGIMIFINTFAMGMLLRLFWKTTTPLPASYLTGIRFGILGFIIGSLQGMVMIINCAHTIGMPDGGPGLPWFNWSTSAGDLRIAHFIGLHSLQALPLFGWLVRGKTNSKFLTRIFSAVYFGVMIALFLQAMFGRPFIGIE